MTITAYPLCWPVEIARAKYQIDSPFGRERLHHTSTDTADLEREIRLMGGQKLVCSSNLRVKPNGMPYANQAQLIEDPGMAVYWERKDENYVLTCDKYHKAGCNLRAIVKHIDALRGTERWGCGTLAQAFTGYLRIEEQSGGVPWWETLGFDEPTFDVDAVVTAYKARAMICHPERPTGDRDEWDRLQDAVKQAKDYHRSHV